MNRYWALLFLFLSVSTAVIVYLITAEVLLLFMKRKNLITVNYAGRQVINSGGLMLLMPVLLASLPIFLLNPRPVEVIFILMIPMLAFTGLIDDILGDTLSKGLTGHANVILKNGFSTGILKALSGGMIGLLLAWISYQSLLVMFLDVFIFALSVNAINLLDLRPGRAIKGFGFLILIIAAVARFAELQFVLPVIIVLLLYIGGELEEVYMLGDTGASLLGGILGFYGLMVLNPTAKVILFTLLFSMHVLSEFVSLSELIEHTSWLNRLDMLGRVRKRSRINAGNADGEGS